METASSKRQKKTRGLTAQGNQIYFTTFYHTRPRHSLASQTPPLITCRRAGRESGIIPLNSSCSLSIAMRGRNEAILAIMPTFIQRCVIVALLLLPDFIHYLCFISLVHTKPKNLTAVIVSPYTDIVERATNSTFLPEKIQLPSGDFLSHENLVSLLLHTINTKSRLSL